MGTRSLTYFYQNSKPFCAFYRQMDGYPEGHGVALGEILAPITLVNGYQMNMTAGEYANGPGCLAAQVIQRLKEEHGIGGIYMITPNPEDHKDSWQEYEYHVHVNTIGEGFEAKYVMHVEVTDTEKTLFSGSAPDFLKWANKPKRNKDGDYIPVIKAVEKPVDPHGGFASLRDALHQKTVQVRFTKADGSKRVMECTTNPENIPEDDLPMGTGNRAPTDPHLFKVYDLEKSGWRSFREERVIDWKVL